MEACLLAGRDSGVRKTIGRKAKRLIEMVTVTRLESEQYEK